MAAVLVSACLGVRMTSTDQFWQAITAYQANNPLHVIIVEMRLPRILVGALVGASLAVAGVIMQAMTQNPLASPSLMGLNAGGTLLLALGVAFIPNLTLPGAIALSFIGAGLGALLVYLLVAASPRGSSPVRMVLAGMIVSILLGALTQGLVQQLQLAFDMLFWAVGGLSSTRWEQFWPILPPMTVGFLAAMALAPQWTILSLGNDSAVGLGINLRWTRLWGPVIVLLLAGSSIAVAGPVMLVGLIVPHISRFLVGMDCRKVLPLAMALGAILVVAADTICRALTQSQLPLGALTALIGGIVFVVLARRGPRLEG